MARTVAKDQPIGFPNRIEKVAIVGAGGRVGKHIVEHLLKTRKHSVTAISRMDGKNELPDGVKVAHVNYDNESTIVAALQGQQVLIITMAVTAPPDAHSKLVRAAAKSGVPYVFPNWWGSDITNDSLSADTMLGPVGKAHCAEIESLGVSSWILLCCSFWYEFSLAGGSTHCGFDFKNRSLVLFDEGTTLVNTSTWSQCGRAIAALLSLKELPADENDKSPTVAQFRNGSVYISSFRISQQDMFESVKRVTATTDSDWTVTKEPSHKRVRDVMEEFKKGDQSGFAKLLYSRVFYPNGGGDYESTKGLHNDLLGLPKEDLDEWTKVALLLSQNKEMLY